MSLKLKDIKKLAELSAIKINNNKKYKLKILFELNQILKIINEINQLNINKIEPLFHPIKKYQILKKDKSKKNKYKEKIKKLYKKNIKNNFYTVPKIINK
ncbi:MAG TPA: Asp-tRNA(Asn)/Glu-tRNA(Gln) amidotransferase subunit GatC [Candidatus Azosocius sp. HAIN]